MLGITLPSCGKILSCEECREPLDQLFLAPSPHCCVAALHFTGCSNTQPCTPGSALHRGLLLFLIICRRCGFRSSWAP